MQADGTEKMTKVPYTPGSARRASSTDPTTWGTYEAAQGDVRARRADGIGYVFSADDSYFGIDLDGCRNPLTGALEPWAHAIVKRFGTYTEPSPSGTGVHIIGKGTKPARDSRKGKHIECYDRARFFTMTLSPLPGHDRLRDCGEVLRAWHREVWPQVVKSTTTAAPALTLEDQDVMALLRSEQTGKGAALLAGDLCGHASPSEARAALAWKACFYTDDPEQIARILLASGLFKASDDEQERERRARQDATAGLESYTGARYSPGSSRDLRVPVPPVQEVPAETPDEVKALRAELARVKAERDAYRDHFRALVDVLGIEELDATPKLVSLGVLLTAIEFKAKGRKPSPQGDYHMPASWIGRYCGMNDQAVNRQLKKLKDEEMIDRDVRKGTTLRTEELVDQETGEIERETYESRGNQNFITLPDNVLDLVPRLKGYRKPEDAPKRGGVRVPDCEKHPGAGLVKRTAYYCAGCYHEAERDHTRLPAPLMVSDPQRVQRDEDAPESGSPIKHECDTPPVAIGGSSLIGEVAEEDDRPEPRGLAGIDPAPAPGIKLESNPSPCLDCGTPTANRYRCDRCIELARLEHVS